MINTTELSYYFEQIVLQKKRRILHEIFTGNPEKDEEAALDFLRYVIENVLYWTPEQAYKYLTFDILNRIGVGFLKNYITFPPEFSKTLDFYLVVVKAYPNEFKIDYKKQVLLVYQRHLSGVIKHLPLVFFSGERGRTNACWCLEWAIQNNGEFSMEKPAPLFRLFTFKKCESFLKKYKLLEVSNALFPSHLEFLYLTYPEGRRNDPDINSNYLKYKTKLEEKKVD